MIEDGDLELLLHLAYFRNRWREEKGEFQTHDDLWEFADWCRDLVTQEGEVISSRKAWFGDPVFDIDLYALGGIFLLLAPEEIADEMFLKRSDAERELNSIADDWNKESAELVEAALEILETFLDDFPQDDEAAFRAKYEPFASAVTIPEDLEKYIETIGADVDKVSYLGA